jgi:acid phosphatase
MIVLLALAALGCGGNAGVTSAALSTTSSAALAPAASLTATPPGIPLGQTSTLSWETRNAGSVTLDDVAVASSGTTRVSPAQTRTYTLIATGAGGTKQAQATVTVTPAAATTASLTATPATIAPGKPSVLQWTTQNADTLTLNGSPVGGPDGTMTVNPNQTTKYTLVATGPSGTQTVSATVTVTAGVAHVAIVVMENKSFANVIGNTAAPYMNALAQQYAMATNYHHNLGGSSLPDYFMLTVGDTVAADASYTGTITIDNVVRVLTNAGKTWKAYMEDLPSAGYITKNDAGINSAGLPAYVYIHNPFIFLCDVVGGCPTYNPAQALNVVPYTQLATDIATANLPDYIFIVPNNCHNTHDCSLSEGDAWLAANVPALLNDAAFQSGGILVITFDESSDTSPTSSGLIPMIIAGATVKPGYVSTTFYQHQSTLRLMLRALGVFNYPNAAATAPDMDEFFTAPLP